MVIDTIEGLDNCLCSIYQPHRISDYIPQGRIIDGCEKPKKGCTAVSLTVDVVNKAIASDADFLIVHHAHGFWKSDSRRILGAKFKKFKGLLCNEIALFGFHLPMDMQPDLGNNAQIIKKLGLKLDSEFHKIGDFCLGKVGKFENPMHFDDFCELVTNRIGPLSFSFPFGRTQISKVAICSGGGSSLLEEAKQSGADVFLTGEIKETSFVFCQDESFNCLAAGHYQTETFGPKAIANYLSESKGLPTTFIDSPGLV